MKQVYSYREIAYLIEQKGQVMFPCHPEARVGAVQKHPDRDTITVTLHLSSGKWWGTRTREGLQMRQFPQESFEVRA